MLAVGSMTTLASTPEHSLPDGVLAQFSIPDMARWRGPQSQMPPLRLWHDPAMKAFRARFATESRRRFLDPLRQVTGIDGSSLVDLTSGRLTLAWLPNTGAPGDASRSTSAFLLLLDLGANTNAFDRLTRAFADDAIARAPASTVTTSVVRDVTFLSRRIRASDWQAVFDQAFPSPADTPRSTNSSQASTELVHFGRIGSLGVATTLRSDLGPVVDRLRQPPAPAADRSRSTGRDLLFEGTVERAGLERLMHLPAAETTADLSTLSPLNRLKVALGLSGLQRARISADAWTNGWALDVALDVPKPLRRGLLALLDPQPLDAGPPPFIPSNTLQFTRVRLSASNAWSQLERTLGDIDPAVLGVFQLFTGYAGRTEDADFDFHSRVVQLLGDDLILASGGIGGPPTPGGATSNLPAGLLLLGSPRAPELAAGLRTVAAPSFLATFFPPDTPEPTRTQREVHGQVVTTVALPPMPWMDGRTGTLSIASSKGYSAVATEPAWMELFLATNMTTGSLHQRPGFLNAMAAAGGPGTGLVLYHDEQTAARNFFGATRGNPAFLDSLLQWIAFSDTATRLVSGVAAWLDFTALPAFETVAGHFGPCVQCGRVDETGFVLRAVRLETSKP